MEEEDRAGCGGSVGGVEEGGGVVGEVGHDGGVRGSFFWTVGWCVWFECY